MAFFSPVQPGQKFTPSAAVENAIRAMLNKQSGISAGDAHRITTSKLKVYNNTAEILIAGQAVSFDNDVIIADSIPVKKYSASVSWGVLATTLQPDGFGECIVSGAVLVTITGSGTSAEPASDGKSFVAGNSGAQILCLDAASGTGMILLGGGVGSGEKEYNGQHKLMLRTAKDAQGVTTQSVYVADGATFDSATGNSDTSRVEVNGVCFDLPPQQFTLAAETMYIYVKFSAATSSEAASVKYETGKKLPSNSSLSSYYLIGRCIYANGSFSIQQDHIGTSSNGVVRINWGRLCNVE